MISPELPIVAAPIHLARESRAPLPSRSSPFIARGPEVATIAHYLA